MNDLIERTAEQERAAIVAWLKHVAGPLPKGVLNGEVWILHRCADAIERGDHHSGETNNG